MSAIVHCWWSTWEWLARPVRYRAVRALHVAAETKDRDRLRSLLTPNVSVVVDSGRGDPSGVRVVHGISDAAVMLELGFARKHGIQVTERSVNNQAGLIISRAGAPIASVAVDFTGRLVSVVWVRLDPVEQRHWNSVYA
ncbi:hypothetical protein [Leifsonia shinshuensis]|uniref:hypothetical protein n=1 Tax=Leifsonia shinshuensis TaxID=150026 RepID=UPI002856E767|nr:hypothetical protein [Leifsonia shinshuensis]MDR6969765.1 hypothetical protein [Leifsonia shinshuensis]